MHRRHGLMQLGAACATLAWPGLARAQDAWPTKTVKIIAPVAPGGGVDLVARTLAERLGRAFGQTFVVDNVSGGGGTIASMAVTRAAPDGYTLMLGYVGTHGTNPAVRKLPYDAINGFTPIGMVGGTPNVLVVSPSLPVTTLAAFVAHLKAQPGRLSYGSAGQGTLTHLVMEQFKEDSKTFMVHAPYRGIGPALFDVMGGQTQASFPGLAAALPHITSKKLRALAVTGAKRHRLLPDVPTMAELGYQGFDGVQWYGLMGPAGLPKALVTRLNAEINQQINTPEVRDKLAGEALDVLPMSPDQFGAYVKADIAKWSRLLQVRKIDID